MGTSISSIHIEAPGGRDLFGSTKAHDHGCRRLIKIPSSWTVEALFDGEDNRWRYKLQHCWGSGPTALIVMMNPSAAGFEVGDMTVMKTATIFRRLGFGGQWIGNVCAYRHVSPKALLKVEDPVGPGNRVAVLQMAREASMVVIAHGKLPGELQQHAHETCQMLQEAGHKLHVLRLSNDGTPMHPLARGKNFIPDTVRPEAWQWMPR